MPCSNFRLGATVILHYLSRKLEAARKRFLANAFPDLDLNCRQDDEPLLHRAPSQISEELEHDPDKRVPVFRNDHAQIKEIEQDDDYALAANNCSSK